AACPLRSQTNCPNTAVWASGSLAGSPFDVSFGTTNGSGSIDQFYAAPTSVQAYTNVQLSRAGSSVKTNGVNVTLNPTTLECTTLSASVVSGSGSGGGTNVSCT